MRVWWEVGEKSEGSFRKVGGEDDVESLRFWEVGEKDEQKDGAKDVINSWRKR